VELLSNKSAAKAQRKLYRVNNKPTTSNINELTNVQTNKQTNKPTNQPTNEKQPDI